MVSTDLHAEREQLEHQRWRLEDILANQQLSAEMEDHLRQRLTKVCDRLAELVPYDVGGPFVPHLPTGGYTPPMPYGR